ncbi:phosphoenolpyruvate carboxykinase (ATP) [Flavobacterium rhizosphaerae]|uniref:Phosphoenolpyruvate carboxykinase (ATP) n=1 Tax=Flavobacterium rhizosphaerae TaxID=3163298 RepID=A0ABW8YTQ4_9FLAO
MSQISLKPKTISLSSWGIRNGTVYYQLSPEDLQKIILDKGQGVLTDSGALAINTGKFTGRIPNDRYIVRDELTESKVWWGTINKIFPQKSFDRLLSRVTAYLSGKEIFVRDGFTCADSEYRTGVRVITEYASSNLFAYNMFIRPSADELEGFTSDWTVINAPGFTANPVEDGTVSPHFTILDFSRKIVLTGGTAYTGEIKKGIFSALNFELPLQKDVFPMHCSANVDEEGNTALFFGLSGTGKTTLSADPDRFLVGDDEHGWTPDHHIFNIEGGSYAKVINLSKEHEPAIYNAIKPGALLENVVVDKQGKVDYNNDAITQNTRVSYPLHYIDKIIEPSVAKAPEHIFFLTADAFGVLPPIAQLTPKQAFYYFISGYTAKVAGTEAGVSTPEPVFSACFGAPFMPLHPEVYGKMLQERIKQCNAKVWLINTGWTSGAYGQGHRIALAHTRAIIKAVLNGDLTDIEYKTDSVFNLQIPVACPGVPNELLQPRDTWDDRSAYDLQADKLLKAFEKNYQQFAVNKPIEESLQMH